MKRIKYGHILSSSKILQLVWWGQRRGTRVRWKADRESEIIGRDSKGEKKKLKMGFVPARSLSLPKAELSPKILKSCNPSTAARNFFKSVPAVCISPSLSCELLHVPGQWVPFPGRWRCQPCRYSSQNSGCHPIILNIEIALKIMLLKHSNQKQCCIKIQTVCIFIRVPLVCVYLVFSLLISTTLIFTEDKYLKGSIQT